MRGLIERLGKAVKGVLTGFDRIVFKGAILPLMYEEGAMDFLQSRGVLNKDYKDWMLAQTAGLVDALERRVQRECGRGITPLSSWREDKDQLAKSQQQVLGRQTGLLGAWSCVESARSYRARYDAQAGYPQLRHYRTACKHVYLYVDHPEYGFMNIRMQTWFPYAIQICLNGRQWLRRRLEKRQAPFALTGNKFVHLEDFAQAQRYLDAQLDRCWPQLLDGFLPLAFPTMRATLGPHLRYYWTLWQSEWATDLVVGSAAELQGTMDAVVRHAVLTDTATRVLRYLGCPVTAAGRPHAASRHAVSSRVLDFHDGVRVRHWVDHNSVKLYNEYNVLRAETTINTPGMFRVYRRAQGEPASAKKKLRPLRKGVADLAMRAKVSQQVNNRFLDGVANFSDATPMRALLGEVTRGRVQAGRRVRALEPTGKDRELLEAIGDPIYCVCGITNSALRERLRTTAWGSGRTDAQLSARISRHLRLLREHGLIRKIPSRRRYQLTAQGRQFTAALSAMLGASTEQLMKCVA